MNFIRHPLFNFLLGTFFGLCFGAAIATHVLTKRVEQANRECTKKLNAMVPACTVSVGYARNGFCSNDGKVWFPARADGICYAADDPQGVN